uniref:Uncharacterized protein n=1 Tax=Caenorhabditis japonica TaxID=281687 RepID=A0A8R1HTF7_CAEJA
MDCGDANNIDKNNNSLETDGDSFAKLVAESNVSWEMETGAGDSNVFDKIVFQDSFYDLSQDSFRYGRMTTGTSYNMTTGKMTENVLEAVKANDEKNDDVEELKIPVEPTLSSSFTEMYNTQMPKYFEHRSPFPQVKGIWTILFDQEHYQELSTFELQAAICAALNSKHHMMLCVGVDSYNFVTGVEMSAVDRVVFRMALTRAVVGEFQPPLVKIAPKQLTGISPMKRDVSELLPSIDVLFIPVIGAPGSDEKEGLTNRFLIVVRVKEITEKLYQLSSGRVYVEQQGRVVEMASLDEAFRTLVSEKSLQDPATKNQGSFFMLEPQPFLKNTPIPLEECHCDQDQLELLTVEKNECLSRYSYSSLVSNLDIEHFGWLLFISAMGFGIYHNAIKPLVK